MSYVAEIKLISDLTTAHNSTIPAYKNTSSASIIFCRELKCCYFDGR